MKQGAVVNIQLPSLTKTSGDGLNVDYALTILNSGNGTDKFTLTHFSSHGWQVLLYHDINGNGILDASDSSAGSIAATDSVKADSSYKIIARVVVPNNETLNGQSDSTVITAASQFDATKSAASILKTNVQAAVIATTAALSVDNAAPNPPGPITFTLSITNNGQSAATNVTIADMFELEILICQLDERWCACLCGFSPVGIYIHCARRVCERYFDGQHPNNCAAWHRHSKYHEHCVQRWRPVEKQNFQHC